MGATPLKLLSIFVVLLLVVGVLNRRRIRIHIPLMATAMAIDLAIVLYLEIMRGVVESIPHRPMTPLLVFHICLSTAVLGLYAVQVVTGIRNARGRHSHAHGKVAYVLLATRFGNLITSWLVV